MPTLEELYARLKMEENFQIREHGLDLSYSKETLIMHIRNVVK
jgi:hypothetical protein